MACLVKLLKALLAEMLLCSRDFRGLLRPECRTYPVNNYAGVAPCLVMKQDAIGRLKLGPTAVQYPSSKAVGEEDNRRAQLFRGRGRSNHFHGSGLTSQVDDIDSGGCSRQRASKG
jgi:hypothetical protein